MLHIALKHGVKQVEGLDYGTGAFLATLCNVPLTLEVCADAEELCPNAPVLVRTSPPPRIVMAVSLYSKLKAIGLCHGPWQVKPWLAGWLGRKTEEFDVQLAGLNHCWWIMRITFMALFKVGIIGCGRRGHAHAQGYKASPEVEIVACADPVEETRQKFSDEFGVPRTYEDYRRMLDQEDLDFVSVCTWMPLHKEMIIAAANSGIKAIHAEKPMAPTWGDAKALYQACVDNDVVITFCHQRRFRASFVKAKELANDGTIGQLFRVEGACPNLMDWGTHWFDMFFFYNNDEPAEWVIGQIDVSEEHVVLGVQVETSGVSWVRWKNGLEGLLATGGTSLQGPNNRLIGTDGIIEVSGRDKPPLRVLRRGSENWDTPDLSGVVPDGGDTTLAVLDLIDCVKTEREPKLSGRKALQATELIFATYESSRHRAKITLPLDVDDSALLTMLEQGVIGAGRDA